MRTLEILNHQAPNNEFFVLIIDKDKCSIKSTNINGSLVHESDKEIHINWKHTNPAIYQEYIKLSSKSIIKKISIDLFDINKYIPYNIDLLSENISKSDLYNHYINDGIKNRIYDGYRIQDDRLVKSSVRLPHDFNPTTYKLLNTDLSHLNEHELRHHYIHHGYNENRNYIFLELPRDFDPKLYRSINPDLSNLNDHETKLHYINYGIKEKRMYKTSTMLHSIYKAATPVFINHDVSLTGAPIFLYDLVSYFKENNVFIDPIIIEPYPNQLFNHYNINRYYHFNDSKKLHTMLKEINPLFIYSNSLNLLYYNLDYFKEFFYKTIFHFHESLNNLDVSKLQKIKDQKIYVVADKIKKDIESVGCSQVSLFPPFINEQKRDFIVKQTRSNKLHIINGFRNLDPSKVVVGMSGTICARKDFSLFYDLAKNNPDIEFVWIGGSSDWKKTAKELYQREFDDLNNFFHIPHTKNPYSYYDSLDYFVLTSKDDPCPIVVLEALLLGKKVICLKNNIFYDHQECSNVHIIDNSTKSESDIIQQISAQINSKSQYNKSDGRIYIEDKFDKPKVLHNPPKSNTNYVVFSYYLKNMLEITDIDYYINILNLFNINNKFKFDIIVYISTDHKYKLKYKNKLFNKFKQLLNLKKIFIVDNKGWNLNGLIQGIKYINENNKTTQHSKIAHLHNKSNAEWRNELIKPFYASLKEIEKYDTIVNDRFYISCEHDDLNRPLMEKYKLFKDIANIDFKFIGGLFFIANLADLDVLYHNHDYIVTNLTTKDTISDYWMEQMADPEVFNKYYLRYKTDIFNEPIDIESHKIVKNNLATSYYGLYQYFSKRGIPDFHFEHCLERYIGYLISNKKKVQTIQ